jgi:hypothetical protein
VTEQVKVQVAVAVAVPTAQVATSQAILIIVLQLVVPVVLQRQAQFLVPHCHIQAVVEQVVEILRAQVVQVSAVTVKHLVVHHLQMELQIVAVAVAVVTPQRGQVGDQASLS